MTLRVDAPGLHTTVQDLGRPEYQHLGLGPGGAADTLSHRLANALVGNAPGEATLEISLAGPRLFFGAQALVALCGADLGAEVDGRPMPLWRPVWLQAGATLAFGAPVRGNRAYLALAGGIQAPVVLGSRSTSPTAGLGRSLRAGDALPMPPQPPYYPSARRALRGATFAAQSWFAPWFRELSFARPLALRLLPGPQLAALTAEARASLFRDTFRVSPASDRMGLRLAGPSLALVDPLDLISAPVATGTLQLPPGGAPILLMADRQTTGGYPRLGEVATVDLPAAAQLRGGEALTFRPVAVREALTLLRAREDRLEILAAEILARLERPDGRIISA
jgi:antagonist of KipI